MKNTILLVALLFILFSCKKHEGKGGKCSISGTVEASYYDQNYTVFTGTVPAADQDVYLIYGDQLGYGEKTKTDFQGRYEFKYLAKGNYTVYTYSKDITNADPSNEKAVKRSLTISGSETAEVLSINKKDDRKLDKGPFILSGVIKMKVCNTTFTYCTGPFPTPDIDVYIMKLGEKMYFDRVRSADAGYYQFVELPAGSYVVYAVSKNEAFEANDQLPKYITVKDTVTISNSSVSNINLNVVD